MRVKAEPIISQRRTGTPKIETSFKMPKTEAMAETKASISFDSPFLKPYKEQLQQLKQEQLQ